MSRAGGLVQGDNDPVDVVEIGKQALSTGGVYKVQAHVLSPGQRFVCLAGVLGCTCVRASSAAASTAAQVPARRSSRWRCWP